MVVERPVGVRPASDAAMRATQSGEPCAYARTESPHTQKQTTVRNFILVTMKVDFILIYSAARDSRSTPMDQEHFRSRARQSRQACSVFHVGEHSRQANYAACENLPRQMLS